LARHLLILGAAAPALAQGGRAEINGTVMDARKQCCLASRSPSPMKTPASMREAVTDGTGVT
jgi:hypothetical protein